MISSCFVGFAAVFDATAYNGLSSASGATVSNSAVFGSAIYAGLGADKVIGSRGEDIIFGGDGNDILDPNGLATDGSDRLVGGIQEFRSLPDLAMVPDAVGIADAGRCVPA